MPPSFNNLFFYLLIHQIFNVCYILDAGRAVVQKMATILELMDRVLVENTAYKNVNRQTKHLL